MEDRWFRNGGAALALLIVLGMALAPVVQAHAGSWKRFDTQDDLQIGVADEPATAPVYVGLPCERTDLIWADVTAHHGDTSSSSGDGSRVVFKMADLSQPCRLDDDGEPDVYWYVFEFTPEDADRARAWVVLDESNRVQEAAVLWFEGRIQNGFVCQGPCSEFDPVVDVEAGTVSMDLPAEWVRAPFRDAFFHTETSLCQPTGPRLCPLDRSPPSITEHGDIMPNRGRYCLFCEPTAGPG